MAFSGGFHSSGGRLRFLKLSSHPTYELATTTQGSQFRCLPTTGTSAQYEQTNYEYPYTLYTEDRKPPYPLEDWTTIFQFDVIRTDDGLWHGKVLKCEIKMVADGGTYYTVQPRWALYNNAQYVDSVNFNNLMQWGKDTEYYRFDAIIAGFYYFLVNGEKALGVNFTNMSGIFGPDSAAFFNRYSGSWIYLEHGTLLLNSNERLAQADPDDDPNNDDDGNSDEGGGNGSHDHSSDIVEQGGLSDLNPLSASNCGFVTLYKVTLAQLQTIAAEMYSTDIWDIVKNWWNKPIEMIAGLMLLPITPVSGAVYRPKIGTHTFNVSLPIVADQYVEVDCGTIHIDEYYASAFDYSPYSRVSIFLPFIGMRELNVDEVMGRYIKVKYRIDCFTGNCLATVTVGETVPGSFTVRYQFPGNCGQQIPTSSADFSAVINGAIQFATVAVASVISAGGAGAAAGAAATGAGATAAEAETIAASAQAAATTKAAMDIGASAVNTVMNSKPRIERSGSMGESMGMMGVLKPYILKEVPKQSLPTGYSGFYGYPSNISGIVGGFSGYTVFDSVKLKGIPATDGEIAEIEKILKGGVIL